MITTNGFLILIAGLLIISILVTLYQIHTDFYNRKRMFDIQIEMAQAQQMMTKDMSWDDIRKILNDLISFTVSNYIINNGLMKMKDDELSVVWTMILGDICTKVDIALSDEIKRQAQKTVTLDYFHQYVKNSVQITIVYQLENNKSNSVNQRLERIQKTINQPRIATTPTEQKDKK